MRRLAALWVATALSAAAASADEAARAGERVSELLTRGNQLELQQVLPGIYLVSGNSNAYLVETSAGSVVIDTGLVSQGARTRELLLGATDQPVQQLILTHAHADHVGGAPLWIADGVPVVAHRFFRERNLDHHRLEAFRGRRAQVLWQGVMSASQPPYPVIEPDVVVDDQYSFRVGGEVFEILWLNGGEGPDGIGVWLPKRKVAFVGDALGPTTASFPNLFTLRGENLRDAQRMTESIDRVLALGPEWLLPGHFEPLQGAKAIRETLTRTRGAIRYVHDATVAGMNQGQDLWTLMREIELPEELAVSQQYGRVPWGVRAIFERYTGWFRYGSTTELFEVPPNAVYAELAELAGADALVARAEAHLGAERPLEALHLCEIALAGNPEHVGAVTAQRRALQQILDTRGRGNFQLEGWLRHELAP
jgi:glyoxylase-like metal-dependent hydrolase (beta-lactamase superfamily II)